MGIWTGIKWVGREGSGIGAAKRFGRMIIRKTSNSCSSWRDGSGNVLAIRKRFLISAASVVMAYGPSWARRMFFGRAIGVWMLVLLWILPPSVMVVFAACNFHRRSGPETRGTRAVDITSRQASPGPSE